MNFYNDYNYNEDVGFIPKSFGSYHVKVDNNTITIKSDGALAAVIGLDLSEGVLSLIGKDDVPFASVDLPYATQIKDTIYDEENKEIVFTVVYSDGIEKELRIDVQDLVDIYQAGNGISIDDKDNKKVISIKISEDSQGVLNADEDGLGINLRGYAKHCDLCKLEKEVKKNYADIDEKISSLDSDIDNLSSEISGIKTNISTISGNTYTKEEVDEKIPTKLSDLENDSEFATIEDVENIISGYSYSKEETDSLIEEVEKKIPSLDGYAKEEWVESALTAYATKEEIPSLDGYATEQWVEEQNYAKKEDVPSLDGYATEQWVEEQGYLTSESLEDYATEQWVEEQGYLTSESLEDYAKKEEIPSLEGYATEQWVEDQGYLTEHQSLEDYAKKEDIPSLDGYATEQWVEDQGYLTEHQSLDGYATEQWVKGDYYNKVALSGILDTYVSEDEWGLRISGLTSQIDNTYAKIGDSYTKKESDSIFATKEDVEQSLATKIGEEDATKIASKIVSSALVDYVKEDTVNALVEANNAKISGDLTTSLTEYTNEKVQGLENTISSKVEEGVAPYASDVERVSEDLSELTIKVNDDDRILHEYLLNNISEDGYRALNDLFKFLLENNNIDKLKDIINNK